MNAFPVTFRHISLFPLLILRKGVSLDYVCLKTEFSWKHWT